MFFVIANFRVVLDREKDMLIISCIGSLKFSEFIKISMKIIFLLNSTQ
jgi:hypothetical protein